MLKKRERRDSTTTRCGACGEMSAGGYAFCPACGAPAVEQTPGESLPTEDLDRLLGGLEDRTLVDLPVASPPAGERPSVRDRLARHRLVVGVGVLLVLVLVVLAVWGYGYLRDSSARAALDDASSDLAPAYADLAAAESVSDLQQAADVFAGLIDDLATDRRAAAGASGEVADAAEVLLEAQEAFATAGSALGSLSEDDLSGWGDVRTGLLEAAEGLDGAGSRLSEVDEDRARAAALPEGTIGNVEAVVAQAAVVSAGARFSDLFGELEGTGTTAEVRDVADGAGEAGAALRAALAGIEEGTPEHERLTGFAATYDATAGLGVLDADHLGEWAGVRAEIVAALNTMAEQDAGIVAAARSSVDAVDDLVSDGRASLRTWRAEYDAAKAARDGATAELDSYQDAMTSQLDRYGALRASLSDWVDRVDDPSTGVTYDEGYDVLWRAESDRTAVRDAMRELHVPAALSGPHNSLLSTIDDAILAVSAAYQGASDAQWCQVSTCYYEDTPGWQRFSAESARITTAFSSALEAWQGAVGEARAAVEQEQLPARPEV